MPTGVAPHPSSKKLLFDTEGVHLQVHNLDKSLLLGIGAYHPNHPGYPTPNTFSKSMGYILNPSSLSGVGSEVLSSSRWLSSAESKGHHGFW